MFTIRCTAKLQKRSKVALEPTPPEPTTLLGDWFADLVNIHRQQYLLFLSVRSRLSVVTPAIDSRFMAEHLNLHLRVILEDIGIRPDWIYKELAQMQDVHYAKTNSRHVIGTMTDCKTGMRAIFEDEDYVSEFGITKYLSEYIVNYEAGDQAFTTTQKLFNEFYNPG